MKWFKFGDIRPEKNKKVLIYTYLENPKYEIGFFTDSSVNEDWDYGFTPFYESVPEDLRFDSVKNYKWIQDVYWAELTKPKDLNIKRRTYE